jgi:hypothetical protein
VHDLPQLDLLKILFGFDLIGVSMTNHIIEGVSQGPLLVNFDAEIETFDHLGHLHNRCRSPGRGAGVATCRVFAADRSLPVERIDAVECQFVIHAHLVPGDLVDHHHRPFATEPIEDRPQPFRRLLLIERGDLCHL